VSLPEEEPVKITKTNRPTAPADTPPAPTTGPDEPNPRNVPAPDLDATPPQQQLPAAEEPAVQDATAVDPEILVDPPPNAPPPEEVRKMRVTG
jgi:hypothetical protein